MAMFIIFIGQTPMFFSKCPQILIHHTQHALGASGRVYSPQKYPFYRGICDNLWMAYTIFRQKPID